MSEPVATKTIDFRLDDSKTEAEILALTDGDNKIMTASDTGNHWLINNSGVKTQVPDPNVGDAETIWTHGIEETPTDLLKYGPQLFANPGFDADTDWTKGTGWTIAAGVASKAAGVASSLSQSSIGVTATKLFRMSFEISGRTAGTVTPVAGSISGTAVSADGTYAENIVAAGSDAASLAADSAFDGDIDNFQITEVLPTYATHKPLILQRLENGFLHSEDLDNAAWSKSNTTINTNSGVDSPLIDRDTGLPIPYQGLIASVSNSTKSTFQSYTVSADGEHTIRAFLANAAHDWVAIWNVTSTLRANVNLNTGAVGTVSSGVTVSIIKHSEGCEVSVQMPMSVGVNDLRIYLETADESRTFIGDGVSDYILATGMQIRKGTIADNFPYAKTTDAPITGYQEYRHEDETVTEYRERLGLKELVGDSGERTGDFKTPIVGEEYFDGIEDGEQIYYQRFEGVGSAGTITLIPDGSGVTDIHSWGGSAINSASAPANRKYSLPNTYTGTLNSSADVTTGAGTTGLFLDLNSSLQQAGDSYKIRVRYMKS
jgi:hypothetical protein